MSGNNIYYGRALDYCLLFIAGALLLSMGLKAVFDIDRNFDSWAYHLPFAAKLWGIIPGEAYLLDGYWQPRFDGFGLLGEFFQGFFWFISGRPETANLVAYFSLLIYFLFLKKYFKIPLHLSVLGLLAIPLVQIHATVSYVDLPSSIAMAVLIMTTYRSYVSSEPIKTADLIILFVSAAIAANMRLQFVPIVFVVLCFTGYQLWIKSAKVYFESGRNSWLLFFLVALALLVIFATPIKNLFLHGNPVYPVVVKIAGIELNHRELPPLEPSIPGNDLARPILWLYSLFETIPKPYFNGWSIGGGQETVGDQFGGYFGAYVILNILLLLGLSYLNWAKETKLAVIAMVLMSVVVALMPSSPRLRYYMFWMIVLVSLNFYLICNLAFSVAQARFLNSRNAGLISASVLSWVIIVTQGVYVRPYFYSFEEYYKKHVDFVLLKQIQDGDKVCIKIPREHEHWLFLYSSVFQRPLQYAIKSGSTAEDCNGWKMLEEVKVGS
ncbi:hypothetical protein [Methylomonas koyamae]|nr:hypothetical protein [Methylomonas koyamae]ATG90255.1 hypothetical protein MKLM6_2025 [Methylomonas koyamae]